MALALGMVPAAAFAADGAFATTSDTVVPADAESASNESTDAATGWRFDEGDAIAFPEDGLIADEGDTSMTEDENAGISLYATTVVPNAKIKIPSCVRIPVGAMRIGIDVSERNGEIDWKAVQQAGVEFAIIRCGYGQDYSSQHDDRWLDNMRGATAVGMPYGVYIYSYADTVAKAKGEAAHIIHLLCESNRKPEFPIYYDLEESSLESWKQAPLLAEMAFAFCSEVSRAGYTPAIYANTNWFNNYLTDPVFDVWGRWVAQYNSTCTYKGTYQMWQCTSDGYVPGLSGNKGRVDLNFELNHSAGHLEPKSGLQMIDSDMFFIDGEGAKITGWQTVGRNIYYFNSDGVMVTGAQTIGGKSLSFNQAGALEGYWRKSGGAWYLRDQNDRNKTGWQRMKGSWYFLDTESGRMRTGWLQQGKNWYYLNGSGAMAEGWVKVRGAWYYLNPGTGVMATGWKRIGRTWYYLDGSGVMKTGWLKLGSKWYYFKGSGAMAEEWAKVGKSWYYLRPGNGAMRTGWLKLGSTWYYLKGSGAMATGWQKVGGSWYYFKGSGAMVANTTMKIGGKSYRFNASGAWV